MAKQEFEGSQYEGEGGKGCVTLICDEEDRQVNELDAEAQGLWRTTAQETMEETPICANAKTAWSHEGQLFFRG